MATHNKILYVVRKKDNFLVIGADGSLFTVSPEGELLEVLRGADATTNVRNTRKMGSVVELDTLPFPVAAYLNTLCFNGRFPKCFGWLTKIPKGGLKAVQMSNREKQELNELIAHGLVKKTNAGNYINV